MIYEFYDLFDEDKKVIIEIFDNEIRILNKNSSQVTTTVKTYDDFKSELEFLNYGENVLEDLFNDENLIFGVNPHMN